MIALRQVQKIQGNVLTIELSPDFTNYKQVEIIILPIEETTYNNTEAFIERFAGSIIDFPELKDESILEERENL
ncbi:MAG: hypothetical protein H7A23_16230 [Leptospiraceae bacterium]|nr:hypothetical protein [Leptospiraceae bacterium]MCP5496095.1 hypothetical protein [Leptospiraceae bacterium]